LAALGGRPGGSKKDDASRGAEGKRTPSRKRLINLSAPREPRSAWLCLHTSAHDAFKALLQSRPDPVTADKIVDLRNMYLDAYTGWLEIDKEAAWDVAMVK
jgi:hypothetical protein